MADSNNSSRVDLSVSLPGLELSNPVLTASGTFGYGEELDQVVDLSRLGGIVLKSVTPEPREGNKPPRVVETPSGMINSIGLENPGLSHFVNVDLPRLRDIPTRIIASVAGFSVPDFVEVATKIEQEGKGIVDALELNYSCPNTEARGVCFGMDPDMTEELTTTLRAEVDLPISVKLSPNVTNIQETAVAAEEGGADMLSLINTLVALEVNWRTKEPALGAGLGGLSGPAVRPVAQRMVWEAGSAVDIPIIGIGGIMEADHVLNFIVSGATAVQVGTGTFVDAERPNHITDQLRSALDAEGISSISSLTGTLTMPDQHSG
jgi:dihydroorotate dehydrogenase (NAD+) catalytic subunit